MSDASWVAASDLATATFCPRQLYYARQADDRSPPPEEKAKQSLAFRYPELRAMSDDELRNLPLSVPLPEYRENLDRLAERPDWAELCDPSGRDVLLTGKDCRGIADKILERGSDEGDGGESDGAPPVPPVPTLVSGGEPPENGVWEPQAVRAVGIAKMLAWERGREIPHALVEYPTAGVVRRVRLTVRRTARYRGVLRTVQAIDGPPARIGDDAKCKACDYRAECGVKTRSLRSLFGL
jgi:CRISPR-associated exonuclease Cas4